MFTTTATHSTTLTVTTARMTVQSDGGDRPSRAPQTAPAPMPLLTRPAALPSSSSSSTADTLTLSEQIRDQLEQDPDYQILRRAFALNRDAELTTERTAASTSSRELTSARFTVQASTRRFELAVRTTDDAAVLMVQRGATAQRLALQITIGDPAEAQVADPLVLDLGGQGVSTTGLANGIDFDLTGDGQLERISTVSGESWFLALDWNANGRIDDGRELFGDQRGAANGFAELARHDDSGDGRIDAQDAIFEQLRLVQLHADGSQSAQTLEAAGVSAIELDHRQVQRALNAYDHVAQSGRFIRTDASVGEAADVLLGYHTVA